VTFARLSKILAVVLVAVALWLARPPAPPAHVIVLALPGLGQADLQAGGHASSATAAVTGKQPSGATFWRRLFTLDADDADSSSLSALWSAPSPPVRTLAVPARLFDSFAGKTGDADRFVGTSGGAIVDAADITTGRLPPPYDRAADAVSSAAAGLRREQWSEWIPVEPPADADAKSHPPKAEFQFARFNDTSYFFSPAYVTGRDDLVGTPLLRGLDRELRPIAAAHALALAKRRLAGSAALFASDEHRPVVVFDPVSEDVGEIFAPDSVPAATLEQVRSQVEAEIASLRDAAGSDGTVLVVGGPAAGRSGGGPAWISLYSSLIGPALGSPSTTSMEKAQVLVRYVCGVVLTPDEKSLLPQGLPAALVIRPSVARPASAAPVKAPDRTWTAENLESVPGAVTAGH
jgi:hypothetical protein